MSNETEAIDRIVKVMAYHVERLQEAVADPHMNERTTLELALMSIGYEAQEQGMGDDVARWLRKGVDNAAARRANAKRVPVTTWCPNCGGDGYGEETHRCPACGGSGKVTR